jgi:hypothetical protein
MSMRHTVGLIVFGLMMFFHAQAWAIPNLQIYIPGATYDTNTETWVINSYEYELWIIGAHEHVDDVKIAFAVPNDNTNPEASIEVTWLDPANPDYGSPSDPSLTLTEKQSMGIWDYRDSYGFREEEPQYIPDPQTYGFVANDTPLMGDGSSIAPHGVFPTDFYEYFIGDFDTNETIYNYIPGEKEGDAAPGQIKAFDISVTGYTWVDIVAYDHVIVGNHTKYVCSPFSHDGESNPVPEPATLFLLGIGLVALSPVVKRFSRKTSTDG